jgi:hypothetical protein
VQFHHDASLSGHAGHEPCQINNNNKKMFSTRQGNGLQEHTVAVFSTSKGYLADDQKARQSSRTFRTRRTSHFLEYTSEASRPLYRTLTNIPLQVEINMTCLRSNLKLAYSLYCHTSSSVGFPAQKKGGGIKLLFIVVALIDNDFGSL